MKKYPLLLASLCLCGSFVNASDTIQDYPINVHYHSKIDSTDYSDSPLMLSGVLNGTIVEPQGSHKKNEVSIQGSITGILNGFNYYSGIPGEVVPIYDSVTLSGTFTNVDTSSYAQLTPSYEHNRILNGKLIGTNLFDTTHLPAERSYLSGMTLRPDIMDGDTLLEGWCSDLVEITCKPGSEFREIRGYYTSGEIYFEIDGIDSSAQLASGHLTTQGRFNGNAIDTAGNEVYISDRVTLLASLDSVTLKRGPSHFTTTGIPSQYHLLWRDDSGSHSVTADQSQPISPIDSLHFSLPETNAQFQGPAEWATPPCQNLIEPSSAEAILEDTLWNKMEIPHKPYELWLPIHNRLGQLEAPLPFEHLSQLNCFSLEQVRYLTDNNRLFCIKVAPGYVDSLMTFVNFGNIWNRIEPAVVRKSDATYLLFKNYNIEDIMITQREHSTPVSNAAVIGKTSVTFANRNMRIESLKAGSLTIDLMDLRGRKVASLFDGAVSSGALTIPVGSSLAAGNFIALISNNGSLQTQKITVK